ncbi:hypothetical protein PTSG_08787 [Salpingoeca rosetta]|uniref:Uncharacterized protein n=1 Tax=Salpingoeca rosetta (strain ATCC 50818 / BSB-021) TaxID=946362 RepID=F2UKP6_SALR5|nr:uncharacterized protein PTSG_08787 [Salpingoeca rosetta]EGD77695.1 hypothetical protein PTSG_08787 [Salpingoeca rosetta]|eukprot:XP_004990171.1 hypothetical protein PTSG_08787 [Salpingoeca rosetta]
MQEAGPPPRRGERKLYSLLHEDIEQLKDYMGACNDWSERIQAEVAKLYTLLETTQGDIETIRTDSEGLKTVDVATPELDTQIKDTLGALQPLVKKQSEKVRALSDAVSACDFHLSSQQKEALEIESVTQTKLDRAHRLARRIHSRLSEKFNGALIPMDLALWGNIHHPMSGLVPVRAGGDSAFAHIHKTTEETLLLTVAGVTARNAMHGHMRLF